MRLAWLLVSFALACGGEPAAKDAQSGSTWQASSPDVPGATRITIDPSQSWAEAMAVISSGAPGGVLVWGDLTVDGSVQTLPVAIMAGGKIVLRGFVLQESSMETFLKLQTMNARFKAGHGGSADLKWRDSQLFLRRRWSAADVALGRLAPAPEGVFQRGEALAAIVSVDDPKAPAGDVLGAIARAPSVFVFAMLPLR